MLKILKINESLKCCAAICFFSLLQCYLILQHSSVFRLLCFWCCYFWLLSFFFVVSSLLKVSLFRKLSLSLYLHPTLAALTTSFCLEFPAFGLPFQLRFFDCCFLFFIWVSLSFPTNYVSRDYIVSLKCFWTTLQVQLTCVQKAKTDLIDIFCIFLCYNIQYQN